MINPTPEKFAEFLAGLADAKAVAMEEIGRDINHHLSLGGFSTQAKAELESAFIQAASDSERTELIAERIRNAPSGNT